MGPKLPSIKDPKLGAWALNDIQFPQGLKPRSPSIHRSNAQWASSPTVDSFQNVYVQKVLYD